MIGEMENSVAKMAERFVFGVTIMKIIEHVFGTTALDRQETCRQ